MPKTMEKLFVYGTLQIGLVQERVFGRRVSGTPDQLDGYSKSQIKLGDGTFFIIVEQEGDSVSGLVIEVTPEELTRIDRYETKAYRRVRVALQSGESAWVYCQ